MENRKLIKSATVLSLDPEVGNAVDYNILVEDGKIAAIAADLEDPKAEQIDGTGLIAMPGFIDTHRHMWLGVLRNAGTAFLAERTGLRHADYGASFSPEDVYASTLSSAIAAIDAGITTVVDHADLPASQERIAAGAKALTEAGLRAILAVPHNTANFDAIRSSLPVELISLALASSDPQYTDADQLQVEWEWARKQGLRVSVQVGMGQADSRDQLAALQKARLLGEDVLYAHCNTLTDRDINTIKDTRGSVSIASAAEMMLGYGKPTIQRFLDAGMRPSLGVDSEINVRGDLFTQMRAVISMQHAMSFEKKLAGNLFPKQMINTRDVIEFATLSGAKAVGLFDQIGTLAPGKQADIVLMRQNQINVMPVNDPIGAVVWAMDTSNVDSVMVAGKFLKRGGELLNVDLPRLQKLTTEARQHVLNAMPA